MFRCRQEYETEWNEQNANASSCFKLDKVQQTAPSAPWPPFIIQSASIYMVLFRAIFPWKINLTLTRHVKAFLTQAKDESVVLCINWQQCQNRYLLSVCLKTSTTIILNIVPAAQTHLFSPQNPKPTHTHIHPHLSDQSIYSSAMQMASAGTHTKTLTRATTHSLSPLTLSYLMSPRWDSGLPLQFRTHQSKTSEIHDTSAK